MKIQVAQVVEETEAEGPGRRFAVWVQGCPLRCVGCCNPEMLPFEGGIELEVEELAERIVRCAGAIEGLTLLGGEPAAQAAACAELARRARAAGMSVMLFSGYDLEELRSRARGDAAVARLLDCTDLLVDGRYRADLPDLGRRFVGSRNQQLRFIGDRCSPDDPRLAGRESVELRLGADGQLRVNGWPAAADRIV